MSRLRPRKPSASMIIALVALMVALGGTSYAAITLPANSVGSKQLKKNAVTTKKIKNHAVTAIKINTAGLVAPNANNSNALGGVAAKHFAHPGSTLASGDTETGVFGGMADTTSAGQFLATIGFEPQLAAAPAHVDYLSSGTTDSNCTGEGHAAAGYLCIYEGWNYFATETCVGSPEAACNTNPSKTGAVIYFDTSQPDGNVTGTWAYTAI